MPKATKKIIPIMPVITVLMITLIVASIIGAGKEPIISSGFKLFGVVFALHAFGYFLVMCLPAKISAAHW